ncbi:hypothetical protein TRFO_22873 [Tritrichomonas foetus]|uniref:Uncharacterized protein n=1 Tax=Tritrichomonas foetus TaxID=1144522 RepID=A0A1J4KC41_9EUKA|nr:hypothetical protein TRFO_22873 [Tritrichomonas foetus]|eukprot:OHT08538.1 hypothetical protein TRFO_22873 [Tritrichomonas foetus]
MSDILFTISRNRTFIEILTNFSLHHHKLSDQIDTSNNYNGEGNLTEKYDKWLNKRRAEFLNQYEKELDNVFDQDSASSFHGNLYNLNRNPFKIKPIHQMFSNITNYLIKGIPCQPIFFPSDFDALSEVLQCSISLPNPLSIMLVIEKWCFLSPLLASFEKYNLLHQIDISYEIDRNDEKTFSNNSVCMMKNKTHDFDPNFNTNLHCGQFCSYFKDSEETTKEYFQLIDSHKSDDIEDLFGFYDSNCPVATIHWYNKNKTAKTAKIKLKITTSFSFLRLVSKRSIFYGFDINDMFKDWKILIFGEFLYNINFSTIFPDIYFPTLDFSTINEEIEYFKNNQFTNHKILHSFITSILQSINALIKMSPSNNKKSSISSLFSFLFPFTNSNKEIKQKINDKTTITKSDFPRELNLASYHSTHTSHSYEAFIEEFNNLKIQDQNTLIKLSMILSFINITQCFQITPTSIEVSIEIEYIYHTIISSNVLWLKDLVTLSPIESTEGDFFIPYLQSFVSLFCAPENYTIDFSQPIDPKEENQFGVNVIRINNPFTSGIRILSWYPIFYREYMKIRKAMIPPLNCYLTGSPGIGKSTIIPYIILHLLFGEDFQESIVIDYYSDHKPITLEHSVFIRKIKNQFFVGDIKRKTETDLNTIFIFTSLYIIINYQPIKITPDNFNHFCNQEISKVSQINHQIFQMKGDKIQFVSGRNYLHIFDGLVPRFRNSGYLICSSYFSRKFSFSTERPIYAPVCDTIELKHIANLCMRCDKKKILLRFKSIAKMVNKNIRQIFLYAFYERRNDVFTVIQRDMLNILQRKMWEQSISPPNFFRGINLSGAGLLFIIYVELSGIFNDITEENIQYTSTVSWECVMKFCNDGEQELASKLDKALSHPKFGSLFNPNIRDVFLEFSSDLLLWKPVILKCKRIIYKNNKNLSLDNNAYVLMLSSSKEIQSVTEISQFPELVNNDDVFYYFNAPSRTHFFDSLLLYNGHLFLFQDTLNLSYYSNENGLNKLLENFKIQESEQFIVNSISIIYLRNLPLPNDLIFIENEDQVTCRKILSKHHPFINIWCSEIDYNETINLRCCFSKDITNLKDNHQVNNKYKQIMHNSNSEFFRMINSFK